MVSKTVEVINDEGLHMRPVGVLAAEMKKFPECSVTLKCGDKTVKATSVMQVMAAGIKKGASVEIIAEGGDEQAALDRAVQLFESGFSE